MKTYRKPLLYLLLFSLLLLAAAPAPRTRFQGPGGPQGRAYLPLLLAPQSGQTGSPPASGQPLIHLPYFADRPVYHQAAVFWFGRVKGVENYADVRIGYTDEVLFLRLTIIDQHLWYDTRPTSAEMEAWDAAAVYLHIGDGAGGRLQERSYRFVAQLDGWEGRSGYEAVYQGSASGWRPISHSGFSRSGWRGNGPNNNSREDRGHLLTFEIPFSALGLSGPPRQGERWKLALNVYDRDDAAGAVRGLQRWPTAFSETNPDTWGDISFGMPVYQAPDLPVDQVVALRHGVNGVTIRDASVGGSTNCGGKVDFWNEWGDTSYPGAEHLNVQNQNDVSDFPCFSKLYITIPLDSLPRGRAILSAKLILNQSGNATSFDSGEKLNSLIQAGVVAQDWNEATLSWNNAPLLEQNISQTWVTPVIDWPGWPGIPYTWDVSLAAARAYASGQPLRLVLYSADNFGPNGKYFYSSDAGMAGRPTLQVELGRP